MLIKMHQMHLQNSRKRWIKLRKFIHEKDQNIRSTATRNEDTGERTSFFIYTTKEQSLKIPIIKKLLGLLTINVMEHANKYIKIIHTPAHIYTHIYTYTHTQTDPRCLTRMTSKPRMHSIH